MMKYLAGGLSLFVTVALASSPQLTGFSVEGAASQQSLEQRFDAALDPNELRDWLKRLSSAANHVGAPHNKENAEWVRDQMRAWGWDAQIEQFDVLYPTLKRHTL